MGGKQVMPRSETVAKVQAATDSYPLLEDVLWLLPRKHCDDLRNDTTSQVSPASPAKDDNQPALAEVIGRPLERLG